MESAEHIEPLNIGMIGAGFVGQLAHLANYADIPECRVLGLAEVRPKLRELVSKRYDIPRAYARHSEMLEDPDIEAVVVVTRRHHTGPIALECLRAGRHLLTEKPMAATLDQASTLVGAQQPGTVYAVGSMRRHDEGVEMARRMLAELRESKELGEVLLVRLFCYGGQDYCNMPGFVDSGEPRPDELPSWSLAPEWLPRTWHDDYDNFVNVYVHAINLLRHLCNDTPEVRHADLRRRHGGTVLLDFASFPAVLEYGEMDHNDWIEGVEVVFSRDRLKLSLPPALLRNVPTKVELYRNTGRGEEIVAPLANWSWSFRRQAEAFVADVHHGRQPIASRQDALEDMALIEAIWQAHVGNE
ncbi:MAG: Gfo/Idh/MocA family oxidoreductase [Alphaproteobacteria bacterium]|nr:Gfo/Idh/MocA family oxidoreductase [Alphaproteobacteria bacterium]